MKTGLVRIRNLAIPIFLWVLGGAMMVTAVIGLIALKVKLELSPDLEIGFAFFLVGLILCSSAIGAAAMRLSGRGRKTKAWLYALFAAAGCWAISFYISSNAPEMRYIPRILTGLLASAANRPVDRTETYDLELAGVSRIRIRARGASVQVFPGEKAQALMRGTVRSELERLMSVERKGETIEVSVPQEVFRGDSRARLVIEVRIPKSYTEELRVETSSGGVEVRDVSLRSLISKSASGWSKIENTLIENIEAESISGDVIVVSDLGSLKAASTSGNISFRLVSEDDRQREIRASSVSGEVTIQIPQNIGLNLTTSTVSGEISAPGVNKTGGASNLDVATVSGKIKILRNPGP